MNTSDFDRLAPRYLEGTLSPAQITLVSNELATSSQARARLEALERESGWIAKAFQRPIGESAPDLSRIYLRVRRRNPYRKKILHPALALVAQLLFGVGLLVALFSLNADLLPPELAIAKIDGELTSPLADEDGIRELEVGVPVTTPMGSQASISFAGMDNVLLNEKTRLSVKPPADGVREVIELEHGEIWTFLRRRDEPLIVRFSRPELKRWQVRADNAQVAVYAGQSTQDHEPRGFFADPKRDENVASVRLLSGLAWIEDRDHELGPFPLARGVAYLMNESGPQPLADPDAAVYSRLRLANGQRFKLNWNWANTEQFPLSLDGATFPVWKIAMQAAEEIEKTRQEAQQRDGASELKRFSEALQVPLETVAGLEADPQILTQASADARSYIWSTLHQPSADGGQPELLAALVPFIQELRREAMATSPADIDELIATIRNLRNRARQIASQGEADSKHFALRIQEWERAQKANDDAFVKLDLHRDESQLDRDGSQRAALRTRIKELEGEASELQNLARSLEAKNSLIRVILEQIDEIELKREPLLEGITTSKAEVLKFQEVVDKTVFSEALLKEAESQLVKAKAKSEAVVAKISQARAQIKVLDEASLQLAPKLASAQKLARDTQVSLDAAENFVLDAVMAYSSAKKNVEDLALALAALEVEVSLARPEELPTLIEAHAAIEKRLRASREKLALARKDLDEGSHESAKLAEALRPALVALGLLETQAMKLDDERSILNAALLEQLKEEPLAEAARVKAEKIRDDLIEAGRTKARAERLLESHSEALRTLELELEPLDRALAKEVAAKLPLEKEAAALKEAISGLPEKLRGILDSENRIRAIERAIDAEQRLHVAAIHIALEEAERLHLALHQSATLRPIYLGQRLEEFHELTLAKRDATDSVAEVDLIDAQIAALRSDEVEKRASLNDELRESLPKVQAEVENLIEVSLKALAQVLGGGESGIVALDVLARNAKAEVLAAAWLEEHARILQGEIHLELDAAIIAFDSWRKRRLGFESASKGTLFADLKPTTEIVFGHAALAEVLGKESTLMASKPKAKQSRLDHEQEKIEERSKLLTKADAIRANAPSQFETEVLALTVTYGKLNAVKPALLAEMWQLFHNGSALLPSEVRGLDYASVMARREATLRDYYHAYLAGDRSGEASGVHNAWRTAIKARLPRERAAQLHWLLEGKRN